jgi:hypothetical protein
MQPGRLNDAARSRRAYLGSYADVIWAGGKGTPDGGSPHGVAGIKAHGPVPALIGARSGREPPVAPLASSGW